MYQVRQLSRYWMRRLNINETPAGSVYQIMYPDVQEEIDFFRLDSSF